MSKENKEELVIEEHDDMFVVQTQEGKVLFAHKYEPICRIYVEGYIKGMLDGIRFTLDNFGVEVAS